MAVDFFQQKKRQKYLIAGFLVIIIVAVIFLWFGYFKEEEISPLAPAPIAPKKEIRINFEVLEKPILEELESFEKISPFEGETGRDNPFLPY